MNWDDLRIFDAAVSMRGIAAAARTLGLSQPQVSRRLRNFEDQMGARLFDRTPNGLMLTPAGEQLAPIARNMRNVAGSLERARPEIAKAARRPIRIALDEVRERYILENIDWLRSQLPDAEFEFFSSHDHLDHDGRETDIQIRGCLPESDTLVARKMRDLTFWVYASEDFLEGRKSHPFDDPNWVTFSRERCWFPVLAQWYKQHVGDASVLKVNTQNGMLYALEQGLGYGVLPDFMGDAAKRLRRQADLDPVDISTEYIIVHRDLLRDRRIRMAVEKLTQLFKSRLA
ncbi:LysR family transcriptional regulator [uncultured Tateyamaria sp.]|uniref:LysR family transcriptional regulator n=1 Tax=uncultured Tateyamaria sp. TaxID=455651 RepID=UPI002634B933|nr:LysR family transcriptional regulator [uncultured Tateyamaria sp.]